MVGRYLRRVSPHVMLLMGMLGFVLIFWLPFGFKTTGLMEEWTIIRDWEVGGISEEGQAISWFITAGHFAMRPLNAAAFILSHEISPDSFLGFNLVAIVAFAAKGMLLYGILRKLLPQNALFALGVALLFVIFPADDGLFTFRGLNIHVAVVLYLAAVYLLLMYVERPKLLKAVLLWMCLIASIFTYEVSYPLAAFTPMILLWHRRRVDRSVVRAALIWWCAPLITFLYSAFTFVYGNTYQSWVLARSGLNRAEVLPEILQSVTFAYQRHFWDGWLIALRLITLPMVGIAAVATLVAAGLFRLRSSPVQTNHAGKRPYVVLLFAGLIIIFLGYIVYMITPYRQLTWRMYYFSGIGGALSIGCFVYLLASQTRWRRGVFAGVMCVLIFLASVRALDQHQYYVQLSQQQQALLSGVIRSVPRLREPATLVVVDETNQYRDNWTLGTRFLLESAIQYIYDDYSVQAILCSYDPATHSFVALPELREQCVFSESGVELYQDGATAESHRYADVVLVQYTEHGVTLLEHVPMGYTGGILVQDYDGASRVDESAMLPHRYETLFTIGSS